MTPLPKSGSKRHVSATMPTTGSRMVRCFNCHFLQKDRGKRATCKRCGFQPIPSYQYGLGNVFRPRRPTTPPHKKTPDKEPSHEA